MYIQLAYLNSIPWVYVKQKQPTEQTPKFQLLKAIIRRKSVGKLLDSFRMYLEVLELLRQYFGGIICPPGWGKVNWVGEKQYCCCRNPVAVLRFSGSVTAQLRRGQHLLTYYNISQRNKNKYPTWVISDQIDCLYLFAATQVGSNTINPHPVYILGQ